MGFVSMVGTPIKHPDWVLAGAGALTRSISLYAKRQIPGCLEAPLVVGPAKQILRGVYGSDLRAASVLLWMALREVPGKLATSVRGFFLFSLLRMDRQNYYDRKLRELEEEEE